MCNNPPNQKYSKDRTRSDIQEEIHNIETLLQEAGTLQDRAQKCKYTQRITMLISKAKAKLLTKFWDDTTEKDTLWDSLEHATSDNTLLLVRYIELDQDEDTGATNNNEKCTRAIEVMQTTQQKTQDDPGCQHFSQGKLCIPGTINTLLDQNSRCLKHPGYHHHQLQTLRKPKGLPPS